MGCIVVAATLEGFEYFWKVGAFTEFDPTPTPFAVSFNGFNGGNDLDNERRSWAASVSSFVRTRRVGSLVDVESEFAVTHIEEDVGGCG